MSLEHTSVLDQPRPANLSWGERCERFLNRYAWAIGFTVIICGWLLRFYYAANFYLDPDEALHYTIASTNWHGLAGFYRNATRVVHPPLFIAVLRGMLLFGRSEWLLRFVPVTAGALFPFFISMWVKRFASNAAALSAQFILTFSPALITLSVEVRAYTLAFLFLSICLVFLDQAIDRGSVWQMTCFVVFLYLAILTEYSVAWFVAALGVYGILRLRRAHASASISIAWVAGQVGALGLYAFLYITHISKYPRNELNGIYSTYLRSAFPQSHQNIALFTLNGFYLQFRYLFNTVLLARSLAWAAAIAFVYGLVRLWREGSRARVVLLVVPFCLADLAAIFHLYPFADTRHTAILAICIAVGLGCAVGALSGKRLSPLVMLALPAVLIWNVFSTDSLSAIPRYRHRKSAMSEAVDFLRTNVPSGAAIMTDQGTDLTLGYYLGCPDYAYDSDDYRIRKCAGLNLVVSPHFQFSGTPELLTAFSTVRTKYAVEGPFWVAAGGFFINVGNAVSNSRPFGSAIAIFAEPDVPPSLTRDLEKKGSLLTRR